MSEGDRRGRASNHHDRIERRRPRAAEGVPGDVPRGVGKTFRMLIEGHAVLEAGRDVVIGLLETHGRAEPAQLADGLPVLPRMRVSYRRP